MKDCWLIYVHISLTSIISEDVTSIISQDVILITTVVFIYISTCLTQTVSGGAFTGTKTHLTHLKGRMGMSGIPGLSFNSSFLTPLLFSLCLVLLLCHASANGPFCWSFSRKFSNSFQNLFVIICPFLFFFLIKKIIYNLVSIDQMVDNASMP